jgi:hypothetical protein
MDKYTKEQRKLDEKELVGQEVEGFKFKGDKTLNWYKSDEKFIGKKGKVHRIHPEYPYAEVKFDFDGYLKWYPVEGIKQQIKDNNKSEEELYGDIYSLLKKI